MAAGLPASRRSATPVAGVHRQRAGQVVARQMLHQAQEERQVGGVDPLLVDGQDEAAALGQEAEVGVLDPLGDALERNRRPQLVVGEEGVQVGSGDRRVDRHRLRRPWRA